MNLLTMLPDDILYMIYKSYFTNHILKELVPYVKNKDNYSIVISHIYHLSNWIYEDPDLNNEDHPVEDNMWNTGTIWSEKVDRYVDNVYEIILSRYLWIISDFTIYILDDYE